MATALPPRVTALGAKALDDPNSDTVPSALANHKLAVGLDTSESKGRAPAPTPGSAAVTGATVVAGVVVVGVVVVVGATVVVVDGGIVVVVVSGTFPAVVGTVGATR